MKTPKGMRDILPPDGELWRRTENILALIARLYGYKEIRTPILEYSFLFRKGLGDSSDVVEKEMYEFEDKDGSYLTLRPEGTAPVVRSYIEHGMKSLPWVRVFYIGPMFRREKPQKGRYRQFHQFGIELFGVSGPHGDAEAMVMLYRVMRIFGVNGYMSYNNIGCPVCRPKYIKALRSEIEKYWDDIPKEYHEKINRNPMRFFDIKDEKVVSLFDKMPTIEDFLCEECQAHKEGLETLLAKLGMPYEKNIRLVRGFDYYTRTVFEYIGEGLGAKSAVAGGGRYDYLMESYGGPSVPGVGFGLGIERLLMVAQVPEKVVYEPYAEVMVVYTKKDFMDDAFVLAETLRDRFIAAEVDLRGTSLKSQMKAAAKRNYKYVLILGDDEIEKGMVTLRDMETGKQEMFKQEDIADIILERGSS
ncbi:histidine--tRNA ligase [Zhurongbacter thermophilus]|jgi:histidyl-tRNA synthetase